MASVATLPGARHEHRGLDYWTNRVLAELETFRRSAEKVDDDTVHDLRVAIRRCRSVAAAMAEVDPSPLWRELRHLPKKLFRRLGELRDAQIMGEWVKSHGAENDQVRVALEEHFSARVPKLIASAVRAAEKFDEKSWKHLEHKLRKRLRLVPADSLAAECLALERLKEAEALERKTAREQSAETWHDLRIGIKKFRYTVESFLPERYQLWSPNLKRLQDVLGEIHDLDVLATLVHDKASDHSQELIAEWERMIGRERSKCLDQYHEMASASAKTSPWKEWDVGLPQGQRAQVAAAARIRATARASDAHPHRTAQISRIAAALFDALRQARVSPLFRDSASRRIFRAAARLSGINPKAGKAGDRQARKAASRFLASLAAPPSWTGGEWETVAYCIRYHRGSEPKTKSRAFGNLSVTQQQNVRACAGILRLARGLRKCITAPEHEQNRESGREQILQRSGDVVRKQSPAFHAELHPDAVILEIPGLADSAENAARLAAAKHLLETYLQLPLILKRAQKPQVAVSIFTNPIPIAPEPFAAASD